MAAKRAWLMKSEISDYSIDDLARDGSTPWTGVRNYEARNLMRNEMTVGDPVLYYHSNADPSAVVGLARVASPSYPDPTQFNRSSRYFDSKATKEDPRWWLVDVTFVEKFARAIPLSEIRSHPKLQEMALLKRSRLSVQPVTSEELGTIRRLGRN